MNIVNEDIITKILSSNESETKITVLKWDVNSNVIEAGGNYLSEVSRLTIEYTKNGEKLKKCLFLKVPLNSPMYEIGMKIQLYPKELAIYTEILPKLYNIDKEYFWPRCYYVDEKYSLILKDLSQSGYKVANRHEQLDFEHCTYALRCLARLHGLSVKLERSCGIPKLVREDPFHNRQNNDVEMIKSFLSGLEQFFDNLDPVIREKHSKQIGFSRRVVTWDDLVADVAPSANSLNVLSHGDCWTNNVMFKYDAYGIIKKVKLIDFQISRWASPALDLIYFTITSMRFDVYTQHFDLLLNIYLETLNKILKTLDCGTYSMENLKKDMEQRYRYALWVITFVLPIILSDPEDPVDVTAVLKNSEVGINSMNESCKNKRCMEIATKWFLCYAEKDIFRLEKNGDDLQMKEANHIDELNKIMNENFKI